MSAVVHSWPQAVTVHFQRLTEPMTGWPLLGVGAEWQSISTSADFIVELRLEGVPQADAVVEKTRLGYRFGLHIPLELVDAFLELHLRIRGDSESRLLASGRLHDLLAPAEATGETRREVPSPLKTFCRSAAKGEILRPSWWTARYVRYRDKLIEARQRLRDRRHFARLAFSAGTPHEAYVSRTTLTPKVTAEMGQQMAQWKYKPTVSVLMPVYNVDPKWLLEAIESVRQQLYPHWELCLADDASTDPRTKAVLDQLPQDKRIRVIRRPTNGHICAATNSAAELATGDYFGFLDNDDRLAEQALFRMVEALQTRPELDLLYSDEDKITETGQRFDPQFKPDWSPELLLSYNYINHLTVVRRQLFERVGRLRMGFEGSQDHDLLLRVSELTDRVHHIPEILYHWRSHAGSTASAASQKPIVQTAGYRAVAEAWERRQLPGSFCQPEFAAKLRLPILKLTGPDTGPSVAIIVYGSAAEAGKTIRAVRENTAYQPYTTYLVLDEPSLAEGLNRIAAARQEDLLLFLQAGLIPRESQWLSQLVANICQPGLCAAGAMIQEPEGRIISGGTVLQVGGDQLPGDAFRGMKPDPVSYYFYAEVTRTVTAPATGCLLTTRSSFDQLGGFDSRHYPQTLFDLDYCLRLAGMGKRSVQVGSAILEGHLEEHGRHDSPRELRIFRAAQGLREDAYHNPNCSEWEPFTPRADAPHRAKIPPLAGQTVLFGTHNLTAFEGAPKILQDVAIGLHQAGAVRAAIFAPAPGRAAKQFEHLGVSVWAEAQPFCRRFQDGQWTPHEYEAALRFLHRLLVQVKPAAILANTLGLFPLVEAAAHLGIPTLLAIQESYTEAMREQLFNAYTRSRCERSFRYADRVVFASRDCAQLYERWNVRKNAMVIHNGLDPEPLNRYQDEVSPTEAAVRLGLSPNDGIRIVAVGTICERKAQHQLVEALAQLSSENRKFHAYLVGAREGLPYLSYVRNLIRNWGLEHKVTVVPETDQVWAYLRAAEIFVCSSYVEAHSLSILEAQAFGLAIVSTPCGGLSEQVIWNRSALRYEWGRPEQLATQLQRLLRDPELLRQVRAESRIHFELHEPASAMVARYGHALATVLADAEMSSMLSTD